jgi:predicted ATPase
MVPSVQLLVNRVQVQRPDFELTAGNAPALAAICRRMEGLPLALELAASCVHTMAVRDMVAFFEHHLDLPISGPSGAPTRHGTLRAALGQCHARLSPDLRRFFARLSVFRHGWTAEGAEGVCSEPLALDYLADLTDCSLIFAEHGPYAVRFRMLELVRQFAWEQLERAGEAPRFRERHRDFYLDLAERAALDLKNGASTEWLDTLDADHENLLAAMQHCHTSRCVPLALRIAVALHPFWLHRGHLELGRKMITEILQNPEAPQRSQLRAEALEAVGILAREEGDQDAARRHLEMSLLLHQEHEDARGAARVLHELRLTMARPGERAPARNQEPGSHLR